MNEPKGQILPESNFGRALTELARHSNTIVEIGCWRGEGSTRALAMGLVRPEQRMFAIDLSPEMIAQARAANPDERITFLCGTVLKPEECDPYRTDIYNHNNGQRLTPTSEPHISRSAAELRACIAAPYVGDQIPEQIDLMLFDGGEYTTRFEFLRLFKRCRIIAFDDIRRDASWKNWQNHQGLMSPLNPLGWRLLFHRPFERHGWSVFLRSQQRTRGKLNAECHNEKDIARMLA